MIKAKKVPEILPENTPVVNEEASRESEIGNPMGLEDPVGNQNEYPTQNPSSTIKSQSNFGRNLWRVIVFFFNLTLIILVLVTIGGGVYFGWPIVYKQYVLPVQNHTTQISQLEKDQQQSSEQIQGLQKQLPILMTVQARQLSDIGNLVTRLDKSETEITSHTKSLEKLEELQNTLAAEKQDIQIEMDRQINVMKGMELLSRARLFLYQSNFGMAKQDVQSARDLLALSESVSQEAYKNDLADVVQRLDLCLSRLPDYPVTASDDLDIAWQLLIQGIPQTTATNMPPTPTASATPETGITPTPLIGTTPTP